MGTLTITGAAGANTIAAANAGTRVGYGYMTETGNYEEITSLFPIKTYQVAAQLHEIQGIFDRDSPKGTANDLTFVMFHIDGTAELTTDAGGETMPTDLTFTINDNGLSGTRTSSEYVSEHPIAGVTGSVNTTPTGVVSFSTTGDSTFLAGTGAGEIMVDTTSYTITIAHPLVTSFKVTNAAAAEITLDGSNPSATVDGFTLSFTGAVYTVLDNLTSDTAYNAVFDGDLANFIDAPGRDEGHAAIFKRR